MYIAVDALEGYYYRGEESWVIGVKRLEGLVLRSAGKDGWVKETRMKMNGTYLTRSGISLTSSLLSFVCSAVARVLFRDIFPTAIVCCKC